MVILLLIDKLALRFGEFWQAVNRQYRIEMLKKRVCLLVPQWEWKREALISKWPNIQSIKGKNDGQETFV